MIHNIFAFRGSLNETIVPLPNSLLIQIFPPWDSMIFRAITNPSPVLFSPPVFFVLVFSNGLNNRAISSGSIPCPLSRTENFSSCTHNDNSIWNRPSGPHGNQAKKRTVEIVYRISLKGRVRKGPMVQIQQPKCTE